MRQHCYTMPFGLDMPIAVWEQSIHCICICIIIILTARALPLPGRLGTNEDSCSTVLRYFAVRFSQTDQSCYARSVQAA